MINSAKMCGESWFRSISKHLAELFDGELHAKRIESLANGTLGVMASASLAVAVIGQALAQARGRVTKHSIKQVDRLLSNKNIDLWKIFASWVPDVVGERRSILVAMDWTDYDADDQATLTLTLVTSHGRSTPLLWLSVHKDELTGARNDYEDACLARLAEVLPAGTAVTILADRGFGDHKLFEFLKKLGFSYVIRFRGNVNVTAPDGETRKAADWVGKGGRARKISKARVTAQHCLVGAVVCVHAKGMKEPWCLATDLVDAKTAELVNHYAKRWTIEPTFRDTKDLRFGMGLKAVRISMPERRDRLLLLNALAVVLLTLLGAAGENAGMDRQLKVNTTKRRTHSLFRQGCMWFDLIPNMPEERLRPLVAKFNELVAEYRSFNATFSVI